MPKKPSKRKTLHRQNIRAKHTTNPVGHQLDGMHDTRNDLARPGVPGRPLILANGILERTSHVPHHGRQQLHRKTEFGDVYSQKLRMPVLLASAGKIKEKNAQKYKNYNSHNTILPC